ncbi:AraC-like ligand-binding domain-containing protein [Streptomyces pseudovenezuelae]|uniref:AraC-like ligand-binding domain-containing protein n=1 Tax=Streptomyces pseudovenezuelae TaxID=67350 RepID=UPI002E81A5A1|nr:helix-turn-helix domain-containing protein [Streptomyces pseudovenezuelae]WUA85861.1 helix-turn-helix domain-containing protein [Streptomyces pseudovenezuelae]
MFETVYSSDEWPPGERFDRWREMITRSYLPSAVSCDEAADFHGVARVLQAGPVHVATLRLPALQVLRTPIHVRRFDPDQYQLAMTLQGRRTMAQSGLEVAPEVGDLVLNDSSHPYESWMLPDGGVVETITVGIPRAALPLPRAKVDQLLAAPMAAGTGLEGLLAQFLVHLVAESESYRPQDTVRLGTVVLDLATAVLAHRTETGDVIPPESRQRVLLVSIHAFIERRLGTVQLSPALVAAAHHISVRQLHRLFLHQGTTVSEWIRHRRLECCRRDLLDPRLAELPVHAVGARWGFKCAADFSRAFKTAYGTPPGDFRRRNRPGPTKQRD